MNLSRVHDSVLKAVILKSHCTIKYHSSPAANPINSFKDVLENGDIKVITVKGSSYESNLKSSAAGTAKREVYKSRIESNEDVLYSSLEEAKEVVLKEPNTYLFAHDSSANTRPGYSHKPPFHDIHMKTPTAELC